MKMNIEQKLKELSSLDDGHYCGSACFLSTLFYVKSFFSIADKSTRKAFPDLEKELLLAYDADAELFSFSRKKEGLSKKEYDRIFLVFQNEISILEELDEMIGLATSLREKKYALAFLHKKEFIYSLASENLSAFQKREDYPEKFSQIERDLFLLMKKETDHA